MGQAPEELRGQVGCFREREGTGGETGGLVPFEEHEGKPEYVALHPLLPRRESTFA